MSASRLYHNPQCSKSRATLDLLREHGVQPEVIVYLDTPPGTQELRGLLGLLALPPRALLRTGETDYLSLGLDALSVPDEALIDAMVTHPHLIERPIFVHGGRAVIGRPPERVLELLAEVRQ